MRVFQHPQPPLLGIRLIVWFLTHVRNEHSELSEVTYREGLQSVGSFICQIAGNNLTTNHPDGIFMRYKFN
jgi:hypothetical protein